MVEIDGKLFKYYNDKVKIILDGDCGKLSGIDNISATDSSIGIVVLKQEENEFEGLARINSASNWDLGNVANGDDNTRLIVYSKFYSLGVNAAFNSSTPQLRGFIGKARLVPLKKRSGRRGWYDSFQAYLRWESSYTGNTVNAIWWNGFGFPAISQSNYFTLSCSPTWNATDRLSGAIDVPYLRGINGIAGAGEVLVLNSSSVAPIFYSHTFAGSMERRGAWAYSTISF